jgi:hypothetical protein
MNGGTRQARLSRHAADSIKPRAYDEWTWSAEERERVRGRLEIAAGLKFLPLQRLGGAPVEGCDCHSCQDGHCARSSVTLCQPWANPDGTVLVKILRARARHQTSGVERRAGGKHHTQKRAKIHFGIRSARRCMSWGMFGFMQPIE